jgi:hypothetical protein
MEHKRVIPNLLKQMLKQNYINSFTYEISNEQHGCPTYERQKINAAARSNTQTP